MADIHDNVQLRFTYSWTVTFKKKLVLFDSMNILLKLPKMFLFHVESFFVLEKIKFLPDLCGHVGKQLRLI